MDEDYRERESQCHVLSETTSVKFISLPTFKTTTPFTHLITSLELKTRLIESCCPGIVRTVGAVVTAVPVGSETVMTVVVTTGTLDGQTASGSSVVVSKSLIVGSSLTPVVALFSLYMTLGPVVGSVSASLTVSRIAIRCSASTTSGTSTYGGRSFVVGSMTTGSRAPLVCTSFASGRTPLGPTFTTSLTPFVLSSKISTLVLPRVLPWVSPVVVLPVPPVVLSILSTAETTGSRRICVLFSYPVNLPYTISHFSQQELKIFLKPLIHRVPTQPQVSHSWGTGITSRPRTSVMGK